MPRYDGGLKKLVLIVLVAAAASVALWLALPSGDREVRFVSARREALVMIVQTNGNAEPIEWRAVRAGREGTISKVAVVLGQQVAEGNVIAEFDASTARANLAAAQRRVDQANALITLYDSGGSPSEVAEIESGLENARLELQTASREAQALARLAEQQAATRQEVLAAEERVRRATIEIAALEKRREAIVLPSQLQEAEAMLSSAEAEAEQWQLRLRQSTVRAPMDGVVYSLALREGAFVQPGELLAHVGRMERLRLKIYVDEPELASVREGMPVEVTWDALPERRWKGVVEQLPTEIVPLGTRQVGEVRAVIDNPGLELPASANINAELRSEVSQNAVTIPKEALQRRGDETGVWLLSGQTVSWRGVELGAANIARVEVLSGVSENDLVALPADPPLTEGEQVTALIQ